MKRQRHASGNRARRQRVTRCQRQTRKFLAGIGPRHDALVGEDDGDGFVMQIDAAPGHRFLADLIAICKLDDIGLAEIGVAWQKTSRGGDRYFAVKLDDPSFAAPIWANLGESRQDVAVFNLLWDRPTRSVERAAA